LKVQHIKNTIVLGRDHMDGDEQRTSIKKLEQLVVVVKDRIHLLDALREFGEISILPEVVPSIALAHLFPALHRLLGFHNENSIFGNQVNGLQIGFGRKQKNIGQVAQI